MYRSAEYLFKRYERHVHNKAAIRTSKDIQQKFKQVNINKTCLSMGMMTPILVVHIFGHDFSNIED